MKIFAAGMWYDKESSEELRQELIKIRDKDIKDNNFSNAVLFSHVIAWMYVAMEQMEKCEEETGK